MNKNNLKRTLHAQPGVEEYKSTGIIFGKEKNKSGSTDQSFGDAVTMKNVLKEVLTEYFSEIRYEYDVCSIRMDRDGEIDHSHLKNTIRKYGNKGWRLKTILQNDKSDDTDNRTYYGSSTGQILLIFEKEKMQNKTLISGGFSEINKAMIEESFVSGYTDKVGLRPVIVKYACSEKHTSASLTFLNYAESEIISVEVLLSVIPVVGKRMQFKLVYDGSIRAHEYGTTEFKKLPASVSLSGNIFRTVAEVTQIKTSEGQILECPHDDHDYIIVEDDGKLTEIKEKYGLDAFTEYADYAETGWRCVCGKINEQNVEHCILCGREKRQKPGLSVIQDIINRADEMDSAEEIVSFINQSGGINDPALMEELNEIARGEKIFGNMKKDAVIKLQRYQGNV